MSVCLCLCWGGGGGARGCKFTMYEFDAWFPVGCRVTPWACARGCERSEYLVEL